ncbi:hypothetical protein K435DRAFT_858386 [Dendrothele bispora CBS 962.96]|uniref:G-protein coupled receptors family 1 profile domain-containing protein n=1 Tax=Dendrothele bispora (strain CBS 962.96) TaxID=1314807 RepID=A0A4S8M3A3_DENBC|nr:hypothetical protein K435DRAFT_858386 [Dendrothele bispora CBS 962.96]
MSDSSDALIPNEIVISLRDFVGQEAAEGVFYGTECLLTISAIYILIRQGLRNSLPRCFLLAAASLMLFDSTMLFAIHIMFDLAQINSLGDPSYDFQTIIHWESAAVVFLRLSYLAGDLIVVWRAWILFDGQVVFRMILSVCVLASTALLTVDAYFSIRKNMSLNSDDFNQKLLPPAILPSVLLCTNVIATLFIAYKAWHYRQFFKAHLGAVKRKSQAQQVLVLLVESGFIYCSLWIVGIIWISGHLSVTAGAYIGVIFPHAASLYPTLIILLSALQKTYCDTTFQGKIGSQPMEFSSGAPGATQISQSIRFANNSTSGSGTMDLVSCGDVVERGSSSDEDATDGISSGPNSGKQEVI